ncbi:hypothetical protein BD410DRAFT_774396 [Rickenella mellea]|uniref:Ubiquitin-activating enzyme E1-like n=1 Tax=Rickenella mellea TaxID=50990 RepID=A0A4Y7PUC0_9AGAM|nr:hypothetical protein BD410DRAFT_774396 [Rickenella mellea]
MSTKASSRSTHVEAILGRDLYAQVRNVKLLLVGAGGIGCELLKNIVLTGFGDITLLDLDTIDLSNLNRQFLFRKKDVKQSKALVAARTAQQFNPSVRITPIHANIKEPQFDVAWFRQFHIVLNALDNLDARRHVNKMCLAAAVPLVESGTAGYLGQVQPILKDRTECFDCMPKPIPKTFPVCTIRSTPSQPIHCIVWAKSYLIPQLFGEDEDGGDELDEAEKQGENAEKIANLRKEAQAFTAVRNALRSGSHPKPNGSTTRSRSKKANPNGDAAQLVFNKVFEADIQNLLSMSDMWSNRAPPVPLNYHEILNDSFVLPNHPETDAATSNGPFVPQNKAHTNGHNVPNASSSSTASGSGGAGLKDQRELTLRENLELFIHSTNRLSMRLNSGEDTISFDKDDDDTLDFVTAAANLRAAAYGIGGKSRWEVKEMAGNIIPAIATTNAVISGAIVLQALHLLRKNYGGLRNIHLQLKPEVPLNGSSVGAPAPECGVCRDTYVELLCDPSRVTLGEAIERILGDGDDEGTGPRDVSVYEDKRILSDPDFDDNLERTLESLGVTRGKFLTIVDEDGEWGNVAVAIGVLPPNHPPNGPALIPPFPLPKPPRLSKPTPPPLTPNTPPRKRTASVMGGDDDIEHVAPPPKRTKTGMPHINMASPSKKKRLEDEGLLIVENPDEKVDDEPELITIDD